MEVLMRADARVKVPDLCRDRRLIELGLLKTTLKVWSERLGCACINATIVDQSKPANGPTPQRRVGNRLESHRLTY